MNSLNAQHPRRTAPSCLLALVFMLLSSGSVLAAPLPGGPASSRTAALATAAQAGKTPAPAATAGGHGRRGIVAPLGTAAPRALAAAAASSLSYHGGAVMHTNTAYAVYWLPSGSVVSANYQSVITGFLQNVAAASGASSTVYAVPTQYWDSTSGNILDGAAFGGSYVDTTPLPAGGCTEAATAACLTDAQLQTELARVLAVTGWSAAPTHVFFLFTAKNVGSCFDSSSGFCAYRDYCAYHSDFPLGNAKAIYAVQPYAASPAGCDEGPASHPNGDDADATLNLLSHEHIGAMTDVNADGWYDDASGNEAGDACNWNFGSALGSTSSGPYNQVINGGRYWLQQEWSNAAHACALTATPPPAVASLSPATGTTAGGTQVTISGSRFSGATAVHFGAAPATAFTVSSDTAITAVAPAQPAGPALDVTVTGAGGTSATYPGDAFTFTTPVNPSGGLYTPLSPVRIFDTRAAPNTPALQPGETRLVRVTGQGGIPATGVGAVVLNVAATDTTGQSFLTVFPAGAARPGTSAVNWTAGQTIQNLVVATVGANNQVTIFSPTGCADVIFDVVGYHS